MVVNKQVLNFFESNKLFPDSQHGFRGKRSTFSAVASMHEKWLKNQERKEHQSLTFLDLSAAFDLADHRILLKKCEIYGFSECAIKWLQSYLKDRTQRVMVSGEYSTVVFL